MTVAEAASAMGISTKYLLELVHDRRIRCVKLGAGYKFREQWVLEFVEERADGGPDGDHDRR